MTTPIYLSVALDGAGWHPAAWREPRAPLTRHIGLMPTVIVTQTEPFHVAKAIANQGW